MVNGQEMVVVLAIDWMQLGFVGVVLFLGSLAYNGLVDHLGERKEGYTSLLVVGGVLYTGIGFAFVAGLADAVVLLLLFMASGGPMVVGEVRRVLRKRQGLDVDG